jgi:hypothetical protein
VDFGGGVLTAADREDIFVAKFSPSGGHLWSECFKDGKEQYAMGVAANASGDVVIIGHMYGTVDFGGGDLTSAGATDIFVATFETE